MDNLKDTKEPEITLEFDVPEPEAADVEVEVLDVAEVEKDDILEDAARAKEAIANIDPVKQNKDRMAKYTSDFSTQEMEIVDQFADKIDVTNTQAVLSYGAGTQKKIADFSTRALDNVRTKDMGEVGKMVSSLVTELKHMEDEEKTGILGFFQKKVSKAEALKLKYNNIETNVNSIKNELEKHQVQLMKDAALLDRMYDMNLKYFKELTMYIVAGNKKLDEIRTVELPALQAKAEKTGLPEDAQAAKDLSEQCERFEKKLHDLELTRTIALQTAPQIRMVQASDNVMAEKIQSTILNTIPLWKNQMVIAMGIENAGQAAKAQREVTDMTNELLKKNATALKQATVETAKEAQRGIVDIETLRHTNEELIATLNDVMSIEEAGRNKRIAAEAELVAIENQLKEKLLEASKTQAKKQEELAALS